MQGILKQNKIVINEVFVNSLALFILFSSITLQGSILINSSNAVEAGLNNNSEVSLYKKKEKEKVEDNSSKDIIIDTQKWEAGIRNRYKYGEIKTIDEGIVHISLKKYIKNRPVKINIVEINKTINPDIKFSPVLATENKLNSKTSIKKIAQKNNSIIAINGSFFKPQNGIPLGSLMIDGKLLTGPMYNRVALGIFNDDLKIERVELNAVVENKDYSLKIDNINQPRMLSTYVLIYTNEWGEYAPVSPKYGMQVAIKDGNIIDFSTDRLQIPNGGYVVVGPKDKLMELASQKKVDVKLSTNPNWDGVNHIISGGPYLVKDGEVFVDVIEQKLSAITGRNPRTAIGITDENNLVMITVDGREESSIGMTLQELAFFMKEIGCVQAMNLDGGGSSIMYVDGEIVNNPSVKGGIAISNAFTVSIENQKISLNK